MSLPIARFALATLLPVPFLIAGLLWAGPLAWIAIGYICVITAYLDLVLPHSDDAEGSEDTSQPVLNIALGLLHFPVLYLAVWSLSGSGVGLLSITGFALYFAVGIFLGQLSNSNAHELIHRSRRFERSLGKWVFTSILFGHHASAHPAVHHTHVATPLDPNTARLNEPFFRYFKRAWIGSFKAGLRVERARHDLWSNPYLVYVLGGIAALLVSLWLAGWKGGVIHLALASFAQMQLLMSDYVQHYGLQRARTPNGYAPVGPQHSWDAPHLISRHWMLNAPRHSDHHLHPSKPYSELVPATQSAQLPYPLPIMAGIALFPRRWKRLMNPRVTALAQDAP